jgi:hypothetical protein
VIAATGLMALRCLCGGDVGVERQLASMRRRLPSWPAILGHCNSKRNSITTIFKLLMTDKTPLQQQLLLKH